MADDVSRVEVATIGVAMVHGLAIESRYKERIHTYVSASTLIAQILTVSITSSCASSTLGLS